VGLGCNLHNFPPYNFHCNPICVKWNCPPGFLFHAFEFIYHLVMDLVIILINKLFLFSILNTHLKHQPYESRYIDLDENLNLFIKYRHRHDAYMFKCGSWLVMTIWTHPRSSIETMYVVYGIAHLEFYIMKNCVY